MLLSDGSHLFGAIADTLTHDKSVWVIQVTAYFKFLVYWVELVDYPDIFKLLGFLVVTLSTKYKNSIFVPRQMDCNDVTAEGELLIGLKVHTIPTIALD